MLTINWPTPAEPVCGKQTQAYGDEIFLEVEVSHRMPMAIALQAGLNIDLEIQVDDRTEQPGDQIQNDHAIGKGRARYRAKPTEEGKRLGPRRCARRQCLMRDRTKQRHSDQAVQNEKYCRHRWPDPRSMKTMPRLRTAQRSRAGNATG